MKTTTDRRTVCPAHGLQFTDPDDIFCGQCGKLLEAQRHCICGRDLLQVDRYCPRCGLAVPREEV